MLPRVDVDGEAGVRQLEHRLLGLVEGNAEVTLCATRECVEAFGPEVHATVEELRGRVDRQLVVWLEGRLLPTEIELTTEGARHVVFPRAPAVTEPDS